MIKIINKHSFEIGYDYITSGWNKEITALYLAFEEKDYEIIITLLANDKTNVNIINKYHDKKEYNNKNAKEETILHFAVANNMFYLVKYLLSIKNINVNIKDYDGKKPIDYATDYEMRNLFGYS